mmetsp:Transcript_8483/g.14265  ORF Transcript_8483/g.14265 Transcript_8483/m.14265 type:complete len:242 (+) Transcript_8483:118-843(+)
MNVFSQIFYALFMSGSIVRSLYWIMWAWPGTPNDPNDIGTPIGLRAFLITYPQINVLICSFLIQYPWLYDFILIQNGRAINLVLRQQMKMFVVAAVIFTVLMYLVYLFAFPINDDKATNGKLFDLYNTLMVFNIISAILVVCQVMTGARRIQQQNQEYGKIVRMQGVIFLVANAFSSLIFYLLGSQSLVFGKLHFLPSLFIQGVFYGVTELVPLFSFVHVSRKFVGVIHPQLIEQMRLRRE